MIALSVVLTALVRPTTRADDHERAVAWLNDFEEAKRVARRTGKPIFVVFR
ncbi:MAG: hypothetical protein RMK49_01635 [Abditibacteriales bacterium]|nr:hypothetical protein [Abditibacteriales bacterium]